MARPRKAPDTPPETPKALEPKPEIVTPKDPPPERKPPETRPPDPPLAREDGDADPEPPAKPQGRPSEQGAARPVARAATPAGRRTAGAFVQGRAVSASTQVDSRIRIKANEHPNFILTHDPRRWVFYPQVGRILPDFGRIKLVPGLGRVDKNGKPDLALVDATKSGRTVIYDRDVPGGYLREYDMLGGIGFVPVYDRVKVSGNVATIETDYEAYAAFCDDLVENGKIPAIDDTQIAWLQDQARNLIRLCEPRKDRPSVQREIEVYEAQIEACKALLAGD